MHKKHKPLTLIPFLQSPAMCGPASLKIVLSFFHKNYSEKYLAKLCGATRKDGTLHQGLINAAEYVGSQTEAKEKGTLSELKKIVLTQRLPVIVGWFDNAPKNPGDHFSVIYHISPTYIYFMDPATLTGYRKMSIKKFQKYWYDFDEDEIKKILRWFLVLRFSL